ncbi:MAG TPA: bestrophin family protein [Flavobacteriales bacterium]|nr:bestrophin family protein [Flavobacteriales bacterium]
MIIYESNKNWLRDVGHLTRSWTMQRVLRSTVLIAVLTALLCVASLEFLWFGKMRMDLSIFSLLGVVLSILLSFRTSTAYDRWWEGRKNWGELVNNTRNIAAYVHSSFPAEDKQSRQAMAVDISNFCISLKEHLRGGTKIEELINLTEEEKKVLETKQHIPNYLAFKIINRIQQAYASKQISAEDHLNIKLHSQELLNILGACERIKKTPIPFSYNVYLKLFISLYAVCLPFALIPIYGYWSVLMVAFVFFAFIGLELMAEEIEDPFGLDCNDLPTGDIAHTIKNNVFEILDVRHIHTNKEQEIYAKVF